MVVLLLEYLSKGSSKARFDFSRIDIGKKTRHFMAARNVLLVNCLRIFL